MEAISLLKRELTAAFFHVYLCLESKSITISRIENHLCTIKVLQDSVTELTTLSNGFDGISREVERLANLRDINIRQLEDLKIQLEYQSVEYANGKDEY